MKPFKTNLVSPIQSLETDSNAASLIRQADQASRLKKNLAAWPALKGVVFQVGPLQQGNLKLYVSTPAALARIRQSVPSLLQQLNSLGYGISDILIKVQTNPLPSRLNLMHQKRAVFSDVAKKSWLDLEEKLHDPDILAATENLYRHHRLKGKS